ncbi:hypothetical protein JHK86_024442 [Glycine max]|nr:hypothetical protein JHK86_024442 [Glycine max]
MLRHNALIGYDIGGMNRCHHNTHHNDNDNDNEGNAEFTRNEGANGESMESDQSDLDYRG